MNSNTPHVVESQVTIPLFPTFVWKYQFSQAVYESLNARLLAVVDGFRPRPDALMPAGETWQSPNDLHRRPEFEEFLGYVNSAVRGVLDFQKAIHSGFEMTGCWANVSGPGGTHNRHSHPNNYLAGVYYLRAAPGADRISFIDPRIQRHVIDPHVSAFDEANAGEATLQVGPGLLFLFPAWLVHTVPQNRSNEERISVSFNIMFKDYSSTMSNPLWTANRWPGAD